MKHEKIFEREDGSKVKACVSLWLNNYENTFNYDIAVWSLAPKKRTWVHVDYESYEYRRMSREFKKEYERKTILQHLSEEELLSVKMELWEKLKPTL